MQRLLHAARKLQRLKRAGIKAATAAPHKWLMTGDPVEIRLISNTLEVTVNRYVEKRTTLTMLL